MAGRVKLSQLERDVRWQADQLRAEKRHTSDDLRRVISLSIQRFREKISDNGHPYYLVGKSGSMTPGRMSDPNDPSVKFEWGELDLTAFDPIPVRIYGFEIRDTGNTFNLEPIGFAQRNEFHNSFTGQSCPIAFFSYNETTVGIVPPPDRSYQYTIWYLPEEPPLSGDDDEFNPCIPGAEQWVVWDTVHKICVRDHYMEKVPFIAGERAGVWSDIAKRMASRTRMQPRRLDTRGMRIRSRYRRYFL